MAIAAGTRLGPYEIVAPAGAGGMGEVYKARDTRLERTVAIKVLPGHLARDPHLRERFEREARAVSSLQHPHICVLHDVGRQDDLDYLVMEYLEGETLAERLLRGALPAEQALRYATEIAEALDRAHKHGIVHRDLKPGNIMLTKSGAKVLDFGLAKGKSQAMAATTMTAMVTESKPLTAEGSVVGTFQYMAPETLEGGEADARSDIFSLGAVMYEMLTGKRAFTGKTQASVIAAILAAEPPPISSLQPMTPPALDRVVRTCLAKDPEERFQSAHDVVLQLKWTRDAGSQAEVPKPVVARRKMRERLLWGFTGAAALAAVTLGAMYWHARGTKPQVVRALLTETSTRLIATGDNGGPPVISPDGKYVLFLALGSASQPILFVRPMAALTATPLPGTEDAKFAFWSPDSRSIGYFQAGKLRISDVMGNPPVTIADAVDARGGAWGADGTILFAPDTREKIYRVRPNGGRPEALTEIKKGYTTNRWPQALPDGKHFLYFAGNHNNVRDESSGMWWASYDGKEERLVVRTFAQARYVAGYLLFLREGTLYAQPFDAAAGKLSGEAQPIAQRVNFDLTTWNGVFDASESGVLVYQSGGGTVGSRLQWMDRTGKVLETVAGPEVINDAALSPDGKRVAATLGGPASDIWILDLEKKTRSRLTFQGAPNIAARWSPDGKQVVYMSGRDKGNFDLFVQPVSGGGEEQRLLPPGKADRILGNWTHDGRYIIFFEGTARGDQDIWAVPLEGERKPFPVIATTFFDTNPDVSPDGQWIAYDANTTGRSEIYVSRFPSGKGKWQISSAGGQWARWSRDGKELYYLAPDRSIMRVAVTVKGDNLEASTPQALFRTVPASSPGYYYDTSPDGRRFLVNTLGEQDSLPVVAVTNWTSELKK